MPRPLNRDADPPPNATRRATRTLRELIVSGELAPGSDHRETDLARALGLSRTPVREAALVLESQGLVQVRPRRGVRILPVSPEDMNEIYEVLTELESLAAGRAAAAGYGPSDLAQLVAAIDAMETALAQGDRPGWAAADDRFHRELVRLGGNRRVIEICERMHDQVRRARALTLFLRPLPTRSNRDHRAVCAAIAAGDAAAARDLHRRHRDHARTMLVGLLRRLGLTGV